MLCTCLPLPREGYIDLQLEEFVSLLTGHHKQICQVWFYILSRKYNTTTIKEIIFV